MTASRFRSLVAATAILASMALGAHSCTPFGFGSPFMFFRAPLLAQLSLPEDVSVELKLSRLVDQDTLEVRLDDAPLDTGVFQPQSGGVLATTLDPLAPGRHRLTARAEIDLFFVQIPLLAATDFDIVALERPGECEILDNAHCLLPYPSSRFLTPDAGTETGFRTDFPQITIPGLMGPPLDPGPSNVFDGFAPTVQILAHFRGVDPARTGASRLLPATLPEQTPPYVNVRTHDASSLARNHPTVLLDADTGERVLHWIEVDANTSDPARQVLFLRPGQALVPGHRYIVAYRRMLDAAGEPVPTGEVFRALRDRSPSTIPALEARREHFEDLFRTLHRSGVARHDLQLAFDFVVRSEEQLHERMLFLRDDALAWLAAREPDDTSGFANLNVTEFGDCSSPSQRFWRRVSGTFAGPNYMDGDINNANQVVFMKLDANRVPVRVGTFPFNFNVAVPCDVFRGEATGHPLLLGHGFLGSGADMVSGFVAGGLVPPGDVSFIAGATDWRGLSLGALGPDALGIVFQIIGQPATGGHRFNQFRALPDRLQQGMVNTLVLSRMLKSGYFNRLPAFQRASGTGVFTPDAESFYFGVSLGGIFGTMYAALSQDILKYNIDVPAMNFSVLQQRSTQFPVFFQLIQAVGMTDAMQYAVVQQLQHEQWVSGEPAAYVRNVTGLVDDPLPNTPPKQLLMTVSWLDKQVSNQASEMLARSLGIPQLNGSVVAQLPGIPDRDAGASGLESALVVYDTGYFDIYDPAHQPFLPPLANLIPSPKCDPHGIPRLSIPASIEQLGAFLRPGGRIFNFCDGACDAQSAEERPAQACNPLL
jgi:hypothetical protein